MNKTTKILGTILFSLFFTANFALVAYALTVDTKYEPLTTIPGAFTAGKVTNPVAVIAGVYGLAIGIGSVIAVVMIMLAGFKYMYQESMGAKTEAKKEIINAFVGLFIMLGSYILLKTINPDLVNFDVTLAGSKTGKLAGLALDQQRLDAAESAIAKNNETRRLANIDINALKDVSLPAKDKEIADVQALIDTAKNNPKSSENDTLIAGLQNKITTLQGDRGFIQTQIDVKTVAVNSSRATDLVTNARDGQFGKAVTELGKISDNDKIKDATKDYLFGISAHTESANTGLLKNINDANAMNLSGDDKKARDAYVASALQDSIYLTKSKDLVDAARQSVIDTGSLGNLRGQSAQFDKIVSDTNREIDQFQIMGRPDLANQLKKDVETTRQILKIQQAQNCASDKALNAQLTLCQTGAGGTW